MMREAGDVHARVPVLDKVLIAASAEAMGYFGRLSSLHIAEKSPSDFVSDADHAVEVFVRDAIHAALPGDHVTGEEGGGEPTDAYWIIDPIDGTSNFLSGLPIWAISLAYVINGRPVLGGIAVPALGYRVMGGVGLSGLICHGVSPRDAGNIPPVFGLGGNRKWAAADRNKTQATIEGAGHNVVCLGSCAVSMMFAALGLTAGYYENHIGFWDCAAGVALCNAAGVPVSFEYTTSDDVNVRAGRLTGRI